VSSGRSLHLLALFLVLAQEIEQTLHLLLREVLLRELLGRGGLLLLLLALPLLPGCFISRSTAAEISGIV